MNLMTMLNRLSSGGSKGMPRLIGAVLLALVVGYSFLTGQSPDGGVSLGSGDAAGQHAPATEGGTGRSSRAGGAVSDAVSEVSTGKATDGGAAARRSTAANRTGAAAGGQTATSTGKAAPGEIHVSALPPEAQHTLALIMKGGPYPYDKDGTVFGNREGRLPKQRRGYYTEYTVPTPRVNHRGARRIVAGGASGRLVEFYYTDDHYQSFKKIEIP